MMLDGLELKGRMMIVAVGITTEGVKIPLGLGEGSTELTMLPGADARPVMIPEDCQDGFVQAFWKRPHALLNPELRSSMALFGRLPSDEVDTRIEQLRTHLEDGTWETRNRSLLAASSLDLAHRIVVWARPVTASRR